MTYECYGDLGQQNFDFDPSLTVLTLKKVRMSANPCQEMKMTEKDHMDGTKYLWFSIHKLEKRKRKTKNKLISREKEGCINKHLF